MKKFLKFLKENKEKNFIEELKKTINNDFYHNIMNLNYGKNLNKLKKFNIDSDNKIIYWDIDEKIIDNILGIDNGILSYIDNIDSYGFETYIDTSEQEYIGDYMNKKTIILIENFAKELDYDISKIKNNEQGKYYIFYFLDDIGLQSYLSDYISLMMDVKKDAIRKFKQDIFDKNDVFYYEYFNHTFNININNLYNYLKNRNIKSVSTIEDAIIYISNDFPYTYDFEYNDLYDYLYNIDISNDLENLLKYYYDDYITDNYWIDIINYDNIEIFKKYYMKRDWSETLNIKNKMKLIFDINELNSSSNIYSEKIYDFIWSKEFFNNIKDFFKYDLKTYNKYYNEMLKILYKKKAMKFNL